MCKEKQREEMIRLLFLHTTTLGVRESVCNRYTLKRTMKTETTVYGNVRIKEVSGWGIKRQKAEYEDPGSDRQRTGDANRTGERVCDERRGLIGINRACSERMSYKQT